MSPLAAAPRPASAAADPTGHCGPQRNLGIDALRIVSMVLIVTLHLFNRGGIAAALGTGTAKDLATLPLRAACMASVDLYGMISGYVMLHGRFRLSRYLQLWLQVWGISLAECLVCTALAPGSVPEDIWLRSLLPVTMGAFWYFSAYSVVFFLSPLLNRGILALSRRQAVGLFWGISCLLIPGAFLGVLFHGDTFHLASGYSAVWLTLLYLLGGLLRRTGLLCRCSGRSLAGFALLCVLLVSCGVGYGHLQPNDSNETWMPALWGYTSPLQVWFSLCVLELFSRLRPKGLSAGLIRWAAPRTFGVYILHVHYGIWQLLQNAFTAFAGISVPLLPLAVCGAAVGIFAVLAGVDALRDRICQLIGIKKYTVAAEREAVSVFDRLYTKWIG